jgi:IclR family acetate operon transcriptional repressor
MISQPNQDGPLDRTFSVLEFVADQRKALTVAEIAQGVGLPMPTAHRFIGNLETRGLLVRAPGTKRYVVGNKLILLAGKTIASSFRTARRHAVLQNVANEIGEQCEIGIVRDCSIVYIDSIRVKPPQGLQFDPGTSAPLYCTSAGKIYISTLPLKAREKLVRALRMERHTERTIVDPDELLAVVEQVRKAGWARTNEEYVKGVIGCAVPITAPDGTLIACLGVSVPVARRSFNDIVRFRDPLMRAARLLSETILQGDGDDEPTRDPGRVRTNRPRRR